MRSFVCYTVTHSQSGDQTTQNKKSGAHVVDRSGENLREKHHLEDLGVDDRITSKWIFNKENEMKFAGLIWFRTAAVAGCC